MSCGEDNMPRAVGRSAGDKRERSNKDAAGEVVADIPLWFSRAAVVAG
jgi:hypothetical protein